ncbi:MAG: HAD family hydrolase, partial [Boseongicola sp. SB0664_bin_43]|nr:HAD family hydrolase [Boseongicola sp. SB0664_bin_43]
LESGANIVHVAKHRGVSKSRLARAAEERGGAMELYEQVIPTLERLRARGTPLGIVTNLPGWLAGHLLSATGVGEYAAAIATPRAGLAAKPKPHGIRWVLAEIGREADAGVWFVGDGDADAEAAKAALVRFAWASYGYGPEEPDGTDKALLSFDELLGL